MRKVRNIIVIILAVVMIMSVAGCKKSDKDKKAEEKREAMIKHLNEKYRDYEEVSYGLDITKKVDIVSICYSTWFTKILGLGSSEPNPPNITEILEGKQDWGGLTQFHYWAKPALGYYRSHDKEVIRQHMTWLGEAGVDFIIVDNTNASVDWVKSGDWKLFVSVPCKAILEVMQEMRAEGKQIPYMVFWSSVSEEKGWSVAEKTYEEFYADGKFKDCFVYWEGKPFMIVTSMIDNPPEELTIRRMWGLRQSLEVSEWSFLNIENIPSYDEDGFVEQIAVCAAAQETYMTEPTAHGRNHGIFFYEHWKRAFEYRPKVITLTWWNEWTAQRFEDEHGNPRFVDNYNQEFSRDIEPMEGGHGDQYYQWMKQYIKAYRDLEECPRLVEEGY